MSIHEVLQKIKHLTPSARGASTPLLDKERGQGGEVYSFDESGHIVHFSLVRRFFLILVIILVALFAFGIGRLSRTGDREPIKIEYDQGLSQVSGISQTASVINSIPAGGVFASSKGKKYYYPGCSNTISEANKITFSTSKEAESAGFTLASNCHPK